MEAAYSYCEALVRAADKDRYLAGLFLPSAVRRHAFAIYAFNAEIASIRERSRGPLAGEVRLQWWRDALAGKTPGDAAGNPVAAALIDARDRQRLPPEPFERLLAAREFDLYDAPMPTRAAFEDYVRATTSTLFDCVGGLAGGDRTAISQAAAPAGLAYGITGLLRALPLHTSRGQTFLPADALVEAGVTRVELAAGRTSPALHAALGSFRTEARGHLAAARALLAQLPEETRAAFLPLSLVDGYLASMERSNYEPFRTGIEVPQWRRQWTLWQASKRGV